MSEQDAPESDDAPDLDEIAQEPDDDPGAREALGGEADEELAERIAEADPDEIAAEIETLRSRVADLEEDLAERDEEIADLEDRLRRKQADFQNYKRRQKERMEEEKRRATEDLVRRLLDVRDNLSRALDQDEDADIRGGVESTLTQLDEQFQREGVEPIEPEAGDELDPERHEALTTVPAPEPEDTVASLHRPGYEMGGKVLRPAQVAVSDGSEREE